MLNNQELVQIFLTEGRELTDYIEQELLQVEQHASIPDQECINALFRAAHTIKGSAGVVGLSDVVAFTHLVETIFEHIRSKQLLLNRDLAKALLRCNDHIVHLFDLAESQQAMSESVRGAGQQLLDSLASFMQDVPGHTHIPATLVSPAATTTTATTAPVVQHHVFVRFGSEIFKDGFDPIAIVRFIAQHGTIVQEVWHIDNAPNLINDTPSSCFENCYLVLDLLLNDVSETVLTEAFEYVRDTSDVHRFVPADHAKYQAFLTTRPAAVAAYYQERWQSLGVYHTPDAPSAAVTPIGMSERSTLADSRGENQHVPVKQGVKDQRLMRVPAFRLDEMVNQLGELVIATATLQSLLHATPNSALAESVEHIQQLVDDVQSCALQLRMVQIGETFNRFNRVVRDVSVELGKDVRLQINGAETELDKSMVEQISDPLLHLVRNALDHGIETPTERQAAGKALQGVITLSAYHDSGTIVIEISDDGRGINLDKVLAKAIEKGLVSRGTALSPTEVDELIFAAGFSTADTVSNLSGRGVGMDVVRKNIEALRGTVHILSNAGHGTVFQLRLPLTLAIIDGFMVRVAASKFVIPLNLVTECIELPDSALQSAGEASESASFMHLRGEMLPFIYLQQVFRLAGAVSGRRSIIVVRYGQHKAGLVVDQVLGEFQTVIKPLGKLFEFMQGISGSSILGSGDIALILDIPKLISKQTERTLVTPAKNEVAK